MLEMICCAHRDKYVIQGVLAITSHQGEGRGGGAAGLCVCWGGGGGGRSDCTLLYVWCNPCIKFDASSESGDMWKYGHVLWSFIDSWAVVIFFEKSPLFLLFFFFLNSSICHQNRQQVDKHWHNFCFVFKHDKSEAEKTNDELWHLPW